MLKLRDIINYLNFHEDVTINLFLHGSMYFSIETDKNLSDVLMNNFREIYDALIDMEIVRIDGGIAEIDIFLKKTIYL